MLRGRENRKKKINAVLYNKGLVRELVEIGLGCEWDFKFYSIKL